MLSFSGIAFSAALLTAAELPGRYYRILEPGLPRVEAALKEQPAADLQTLEARPGFRHFPSAMLAAAVLYRRDGDARMLELAGKIGDLCAAECERGNYTKRLDHHRDTYMWLESLRLLEPKLAPERSRRWRAELGKLLESLAADVAKRQDYALYASPFIGTSPNHYSLWSSTLYLGARVMKNREWEALAGKVLHRFAVEQAPDGFWGEHSANGPTTGYDYLTVAAVALYYEHSRDPDALKALRRSTDFHKYFTYPDGAPVETVNDRNRYWSLSTWGLFGFSNFPDGRRYAEWLASLYDESRVSLEDLGRIAQDALYHHNGPLEKIPQDLPAFTYRMQLPAGVRKSGPWVVCLSGIIDTHDFNNRYYLERQGLASVFHQKHGLIITGANSKRQPELAAFSDQLQERTATTPLSSRLEMGGRVDRLSVSLHTYFASIEPAIVSDTELEFRVVVTRKYGGGKGRHNLQLCLKAGETLETGAGKRYALGEDSLDLGPAELGGLITHRGWTMHVPPGARLKWPVLPYNPYANAPEKSLAHAVGALISEIGSRDETLVFRIRSQ